MPNQRKAGQSFVGFQADAPLVGLINAARGREDKSRWLRRALIAQLRAEGFDVSSDLEFPPARGTTAEETTQSATVPEVMKKVDYADQVKAAKKRAKGQNKRGDTY